MKVILVDIPCICFCFERKQTNDIRASIKLELWDKLKCHIKYTKNFKRSCNKYSNTHVFRR